MPLVLTVTQGADVGQQYVITREQSPRTFGQGATADVRVADAYLSEAHFVVYWDGERAYLRDLESHYGTWVNGQGVREALLGDGHQIGAGQTVLKVSVVPEAAEAAGEEIDAVRALVTSFQDSPRDRARWVLRGEQAPLFALVDLGASTDLVEQLGDSGDEFCAFDETADPEALSPASPGLVAFRSGSVFLGSFLEEVWGQDCAVFFTSERPFAEVYAHWLHWIEYDEDQNVTSPRFWEPEVFAEVVPAMPEDERRRFLGPARQFFMEAEGGDHLRTYDAAGATTDLALNDGAA